MILKKSVDDVLQAARVEEVVGDFVNLKRSGANLLGLCPFHHEKTPSFSVSPSKNIYKCFGCGKAGGPVQFVMEHESCTFPEAIRYLAKRYNITLEERQEPRSEQEYQEELKRESWGLVNDYAARLYHEALFDHPSGKSIAMPYFKERGILESTIKKFQLGYAPEQKDYLIQHAREQGYNLALLRDLGLTNKNDLDFFNHRVIFPIHNLAGKVIAFSGRKIGQGDFGPKYMNSPETPLYSKSKVLYGMHLAKAGIRSNDECILVEGYTDVIALHQAGIQHVVASSGTSLTVDQIRLIKRFTSNIKVLYDGDEAGIKATLRALDLILDENMNVRLVILPPEDDPDSYLQKNGSEAFKKYMTEKSVDFVLFKASLIKKEYKNDPVKKSEGIADIIQTIARIPDAIKRSTYIQICAQELDVPENILISEINKKIRKEIFQRRTGTPGVDSDRAQAGQKTDFTPAEPQLLPSTDWDEHQERSLIRVLVLYGHLPIDDGTDKTMAQYINQNMDDLYDAFENKLYEKVLKEYMHQLSENRPVDTHYFSSHPDADIRNLAIEFCSSPYVYSHNWSDRWEMELQTQKHPDQNYVKDCFQSILRFKLKKVQKMIADNKKLLDSPELDEMHQLIYLKSQHELLNYRNELAEMLGMRVFS